METRIAVTSRTAGRQFTVQEYGGDHALHLYWRSELTDRAFRRLIPLCQYGLLYPERHDREMVSVNHLAPQGFCERCAACDGRIRRGEYR
jgi:hypothetical protein